MVDNKTNKVEPPKTQAGLGSSAKDPKTDPISSGLPKVERPVPADISAPMPPPPPAPIPFAEGPFDHILGADALEIGSVGWCSLDDTGKPVGIYAFPPEAGSGVTAIRVRKNDITLGNVHAITTESGAELTDNMVPQTDNRFVPPAEPEARVEGAVLIKKK